MTFKQNSEERQGIILAICKTTFRQNPMPRCGRITHYGWKNRKQRAAVRGEWARDGSEARGGLRRRKQMSLPEELAGLREERCEGRRSVMPMENDAAWAGATRLKWGRRGRGWFGDAQQRSPGPGSSRGQSGALAKAPVSGLRTSSRGSIAGRQSYFVFVCLRKMIRFFCDMYFIWHM